MLLASSVNSRTRIDHWVFHYLRLPVARLPPFAPCFAFRHIKVIGNKSFLVSIFEIPPDITTVTIHTAWLGLLDRPQTFQRKIQKYPSPTTIQSTSSNLAAEIVWCMVFVFVPFSVWMSLKKNQIWIPGLQTWLIPRRHFAIRGARPQTGLDVEERPRSLSTEPWVGLVLKTQQAQFWGWVGGEF